MVECVIRKSDFLETREIIVRVLVETNRLDKESEVFQTKCSA